MLKTSVCFALVAAAVLTPAWAQSADKKALIQRMVQLQQPGVEAVSRGLAEGPAMQFMQESSMYIQSQIPAAQQASLAKAVEDDLKKYMDETLPLVRSSASKLAPSVLGPIFDKNFTAEELQQAISILESPVQKKLQQISPELQQALVEAVVKGTDAQVQPKITALSANVRKRLNIPNSAAPAALGKK